MKSIDIRDNEQVTGTSLGSGLKPNWDGAQGYARAREIELARQEAYAEQKRLEEEQLPLNLRFAALEGEVFRLKEQVKELTDAKK